MGVDGVIPYDHRVLGGVPGVLFWRVLMISSIHAQWFSIHHGVYSLQLAITLSCHPTIASEGHVYMYSSGIVMGIDL